MTELSLMEPQLLGAINVVKGRPQSKRFAGKQCAKSMNDNGIE